MKLNTPWRNVLGAATAALAIALSTFLPVTSASAAPAAGTVIGNQASATYTDGAGTSRSTTSNLVQTTVSQVKSFTLTANGARTAAPGQTVYYPHVITNTGNGTDTYALGTVTTGGGFTHAGPLVYYADADGNGVPDNAVQITSSGSVAAGTQFRFVVAAVVPGGATLGQTGTLTVPVTDSASNSQSNTDTTTVAASAVTVTKALSVNAGPSPSTGAITVTLSYTNAGTAAASNLVLTDVLPSGMTYVTGSGSWSGQALTDAAAGDPSGINYSWTAGTRTVAATITTVPAGGSGQVTFQVTIAGSLSPTNSALGNVCTTAGCPALTTNTATYVTATQTTATSTNSVTYTVQQSGSVVANGSNASNAAAAGEPIVVSAAAQGATASFPVYAWNTGNGTDTINLSVPALGDFPAGTSFQIFRGDGTTPLIDTNGDGTVDTGPLAPGANMALVVRATLPTTGATGDNGGAGFTTNVTAASVYTPASTESAPIRLDSITANAVDVTVNAPVPTATAAEGSGSTGATVVQSNNVTPAQSASVTTTFSVYVNNRGGAADSYNLSLTSLPAGWSITFRQPTAASCTTPGAPLTSTGSIAASGNSLVCAVVTVPSIQSGNAAPGNRALEVRAQSASTAGSNDYVTVQVAVQTLHAVSLSPNGIQQTYPAAAVTYNHTLTNIGNVAETVSFATGFLSDAQSAAGWTSTAYLDTNGNGTLDLGTDTLLTVGSSVASLPVGESRTIFVRVFAPASATSANPANVTTLTATYNTSATASATDTTSITEGLLLTKEQVTTDCATAPSTGYSTNPIAASTATAPGQCIGYRITATNTTAQTITTVQVSDTIPANTRLHTACGAPSGSAGVTMGGTAANGTGGTVTATAASLAPTASFSASFCVRIDP